jgi:hypothetical protein
MPTPRPTLKVREITGEPCRYTVESHERPQLPHMVDLMAEHGHGQCDCRDFCTVVTRNRKNAPGVWVFYGYPGHPDPLRSQCKHIMMAQRKFMMTSFPRMSEELGNKKQT